MGAITATLPQTEKSRWEPVTHMADPSSIHQESGTRGRLQYTVLHLCSSALFLNACLLKTSGVQKKKEKHCVK